MTHAAAITPPDAVAKPAFARPALPVALALAAGVTAAQFCHIAPPRSLLGATVALILALSPVPRRFSLLRDFALLLALTAAGIAVAGLALDYFPPHHIAAFTTVEPRVTDLDLEITSPPAIEADTTFGEPGPAHQAAFAEVRAVRTVSGWQPAVGTIRLQIDHPHPRLAQGQRIRAFGSLYRLPPPLNPGQADFALANRRQRILAQLSVLGPDQLRIPDANPSLSPLAWLRRRTRLLLAEGFGASQSNELGMLRLILLGDSGLAGRDLRDDLARTGVTFLIATSGLHLLVLVLVLGIILRAVLIHPAIRSIAMVLFAILYAAVVIPSPGAQRSSIAAGVIALAFLAGRRIDAVQVLSLAAIALLITQPNELAAVSLQLGLLTVAGLVFYARYKPPMDEGELLEFRAALIARQIGRVRPTPRWLAVTRRFTRPLIDNARTNLIAWLIAIPIIAFHFGTLNPWCAPVGLLLVPLAVLALLAAAFKIVATLILPSLAATWADASAAPADWLHRVAHLTAALPGADLAIPTPHIAVVVLAMVLVVLPPLAALLPIGVYPRLRRRAAWLGPVAAVALLLAPIKSTATADLHATLLATGNSQWIVLHRGREPAVLVSENGSDNTDLSESIIEPFLAYEQIPSVAALVVPDAVPGRLGAAAEFVARVHPAAVYAGSGLARMARFDPAALALISSLKAPIRPLRHGDAIPCGPALLRVIWPPRTAASRRGNDAYILRLTAADRSILLAGDLGASATPRLLLHPVILRSDILIAPGIATREALTAALLAEVQPQVILAAGSAHLSTKQVAFDARAGTPVWRTGIDGAITVTISPEGQLGITAFRRASNSGAPSTQRNI